MEQNIFNDINKLQVKGWWWGKARYILALKLLYKFDLTNLKKHNLDIGPSEGSFLEYLREENINFKAIDPDDQAIEYCQKRGFKDQVVKGGIHNIPFEHQSFTSVTALDVIEHVPNDNKSIKEINRVLVREGISIIYLPAHKWLWSKNDEFYHHIKRYSIKDIKELAKINDFEISYCGYFNFFLFPIFIVFIALNKIFPKYDSSSTLKPLPSPINSLLLSILKFEIFLITKLNIKLPFGNTIVAVIKKK